MISIGQIIAAGILTGLAVALGGALTRWPSRSTAAAALGSLVLIVAWRLAANSLHLNEDFIPAVSVADALCLVFGAAAPVAVAVVGRLPTPAGWVPAAVGGLAGFVINVVIL